MKLSIDLQKEASKELRLLNIFDTKQELFEGICNDILQLINCKIYLCVCVCLCACACAFACGCMHMCVCVSDIDNLSGKKLHFVSFVSKEKNTLT